MVKAAGADELQGRAESTVRVQRRQKRHLSAAYNYLMGRCREDKDRLCSDLHQGQNTSYHEDIQIPEYCS